MAAPSSPSISAGRRSLFAIDSKKKRARVCVSTAFILLSSRGFFYGFDHYCTKGYRRTERWVELGRNGFLKQKDQEPFQRLSLRWNFGMHNEEAAPLPLCPRNGTACPSKTSRNEPDSVRPWLWRRSGANVGPVSFFPSQRKPREKPGKELCSWLREWALKTWWNGQQRKKNQEKNTGQLFTAREFMGVAKKITSNIVPVPSTPLHYFQGFNPVLTRPIWKLLTRTDRTRHTPHNWVEPVFFQFQQSIEKGSDCKKVK